MSSINDILLCLEARNLVLLKFPHLLKKSLSYFLSSEQLISSIQLFWLQAFLLIFFSELGDKTFFIAVSN